MRALTFDLRYAIRELRKSPGFTLAAVLTLALGISAVTTVFTWMKAILYDPWPHVASPRTIRFIDSTVGGSQGYSLHYDQFRFLAKRQDIFPSATAFNLVALNIGPLEITPAGSQAQAIQAGMVASNYFQFLGMVPELGHFFDPSSNDRAYGSQNAIVLSDALWRERFHADPRLIGQTIYVNQRVLTVVGIAPPDFMGIYGGLAESAWVPLSASRDLNPSASKDPLDRYYGLMVAARLAPSQNDAAARAALHTIARNYAAQQHKTEYARWDLNLRDSAHFERGLFYFIGTQLPIVIGASALLLLLVCINIAALLGQRAARRQRDVAIRLALGASRFAIARQLIVETLLLAVLGSVAGALLSSALARTLYVVLPAWGFPLSFNLAPDLAIFEFVVAVIFPVTLLCGLTPALQTFQVSQNDTLHQGGQSVLGRRSRRGMTLLLGFQLGVCFTVLVCSGLLVRTALNIVHLKLGFDKEHCLTASVDLSRAGYAAKKGYVFQKRLLEELSTTPGVLSATITSHVPMNSEGSFNTWSIDVPGYQPTKGENMQVVTDLEGPQFFHCLRIAFAAGRDFRATDDEKAPAVAIVNRAMAHHYWPKGNALGSTVVVEGKPAQIVGIVDRYTYENPQDSPSPVLYIPLLQHYYGDVSLILRSRGDAYALLATLQQVISQLDPSLPIERIHSMDEIANNNYRFAKIPAELLIVYALASLLVATLGIYAAMAYSATERSREFALRIALGATREQIRSLLLSGGLATAAIGLLIGCFGAYFAVRVIKAMLFGVGTFDPISVSIALAVVVLTTFLSGLLPARRAARADPMQVLRTE